MMSMRRADFHIHTFYQRCANETMTVPALIRRAEAIGLKKIAVTDHLNNFDRLERFEYIKSDIEKVQTDVEVFFGVELNYISRSGGFAYNKKIHDDFGFKVVIGGAHSSYTDSDDPGEIIRIQDEIFMKTFENPLLDVLVHPFWFPGGEVKMRPPVFWENLIQAIPDKLISRWAKASARNNCAVEANAKAVFFNSAYSEKFKISYIDFLKRLAGEKALFVAGSDAHDINAMGKSFYIEGLFAALGIRDEALWEPGKS